MTKQYSHEHSTNHHFFSEKVWINWNIRRLLVHNNNANISQSEEDGKIIDVKKKSCSSVYAMRWQRQCTIIIVLVSKRKNVNKDMEFPSVQQPTRTSNIATRNHRIGSDMSERDHKNNCGNKFFMAKNERKEHKLKSIKTENGEKCNHPPQLTRKTSHHGLHLWFLHAHKSLETDKRKHNSLFTPPHVADIRFLRHYTFVSIFYSHSASSSKTKYALTKPFESKASSGYNNSNLHTKVYVSTQQIQIYDFPEKNETQQWRRWLQNERKYFRWVVFFLYIYFSFFISFTIFILSYACAGASHCRKHNTYSKCDQREGKFITRFSFFFFFCFYSQFRVYTNTVVCNVRE